MAHAYRPLEEGEVFNTFHDMVHATILSAGTGAATLKEIYAACIQFGRVKCRRTGGWRLVTDRRNWKSHIRHTLYTTEKFLRCPHDAEAWMLAPDYSHTLPQTTRHYLGYRVDETFDAPPRPRAGRHVPRLLDPTVHSSAPRSRAMPSAAGDQHNRLPVWQDSATRRALPAYRIDSPHGLPPSTDEDADDADPYDEEDDDPEVGHEPSLQPEQMLHEPQPELQPSRNARRGPLSSEYRHAEAAVRIPVPKQLAGGRGGRAGRVLALLPGSAAAAAAAAAAAGDEELDWEDEGTLTALFAAQEVLNNPTAARILLLLLQQRQQQLQHPPATAAGFPGRRHRARPVYEPVYQQQQGHDECEVDGGQGKEAQNDSLEDEDEVEGLRGLCGLAAGSCRRGGPSDGAEQHFMVEGVMSVEEPTVQQMRPRHGAAAAWGAGDAHPMRNTARGASAGAGSLAFLSRPSAPDLPVVRAVPAGAAAYRRQGVSIQGCSAHAATGALQVPVTHAELPGNAGEYEDVRYAGPQEEEALLAEPRDRDPHAGQERWRGPPSLRRQRDGDLNLLGPYPGANCPGPMASNNLQEEGAGVSLSGGNGCPPLSSAIHHQQPQHDIGTNEAVLGLDGVTTYVASKAGAADRSERESSGGPVGSTLGKRGATDSNNSSSFVADLGDELQQRRQQQCLEDQHERLQEQHGGTKGQARKRLCISDLGVSRVAEFEAV